MTVVHVSFGSHRKTTPALALHTNGFSVSVLFFGYDEERAERDAAWIAEESDNVEVTSAQVTSMRPVLFPRTQAADTVEIESRREQYMGVALSDLCDWINTSQSYQWPCLPDHYRALVLEFIGRLHQASTISAHRSAQ